MQIIPMRDLKNTVEVERRCDMYPVFWTLSFELNN